MVSIEALRRKPSITVNDELIVDLTAPSFVFNSPLKVTGTVMAADDVEMRPDMIAKIMYGDSNKIEHVLKLNSVSNPFSIESGQIFLKGDLTEIKSAYAAPLKTDQTSSQSIIDRFFDPKKLSKKDAKRLEYIKKKSASLDNASSTNLPPNFAKPGDKEMTIKDGKVIFGNDVVGSAAQCAEPLSRAQAKAKLLENRIFRK